MVDRLTVRSVFERALAAGGRQLGPFEIEWDVAGNCLLPVRRELSARKTHGVERWVREVSPDWATSDFPPDYLGHQKKRVYGQEQIGPHAVYLTVRCRMCDNCLKERRKLWARRAVAEMARASRTWFGTLTLSPEWQSYFGAKAAMEATKNGDVLEAMPFDKQLHLRHEAIQPEITKMLKRLRKGGYRLRYMLVLEAHKTMLPHYHVLVHEMGAPIPKRALEAEWKLGFSQFRLAEDARAVFYAAKYLGKSSASRVRASLRYGSMGAVSTKADVNTDSVENVSSKKGEEKILVPSLS